MSNLDTNHVISLDLIKDRANAVIKFGLADVETSDFYLGLYNNGTRIFDENYIVTLYIVKPNGTFRNIKLEPKEGLKKYYCNLPDTLKNIPGEYLCQAIIFDNLANEKKVSKSKFKYSVDLDLASEIAGIIGEEEQESILTNILNRLLTLENPVEPYATQKHVDECVSMLTEEIDSIKIKDVDQDGRLDAVESKNVNQDNRLDIIEAKDIEQDNRLVNIETRNTEQDNRLNIIESKDIEQDGRLNTLENKVDGIDEKIVGTIEPTLANHGNRVDTLENKDLVHESRMTDIESKNVEQDNRLTSVEGINTTQDNRLDALEVKDIAHESRMVNIETKNTEQDNRLNSLESKDLIHELRMTDIESKNIEQDERLSNIESKNTEQDSRLDITENRLANIGNDITNTMQPIIDGHTSRLDAIEAIDVSQNTRLDAIEAKNQQQDDRLLDIEKVNNQQDIDIKCLYGASQTIDVTKEGNSIYLQNSNNGFAIIDEIQGNTLVNCNKEPDKEIILNGNINTQGYSNVTLTEGVDGGLVDVALEGNTMVNVCDQKDPVAITKSYTVETGNHVALQGEYDGKCRPVVTGNTLVNLVAGDTYVNDRTWKWETKLNCIKEGTTYTVLFELYNIVNNNDNIPGIDISIENLASIGLVRIPFTEGFKAITVTTRNSSSKIPLDINSTVNFCSWIPIAYSSTTYSIKNLVVLEGDYTNKPIPSYFQGLQSSFEDKVVTQEMVDNGEELAENLDKYKVDYVVTGKNKFDKSKALDGHEITNTNITPNVNWFVTDFIPVIPNTSYEVSGKGNGNSLLYYDKNKQLLKEAIGGISLITVPTDAKYVRLNGMLTQKDTFQLEEGSVATPYEPYKEYKKTFYLNSPLLEGDTIEQRGNNVVHVHRSEIRAYETDDELTLPTDMINTLIAKPSPQYEVISQNDTILCDSYVNGHLDVDSVVPVKKVDFLRFEEELTYLYVNTQYAVQFVSDAVSKVNITLGGAELLNQNVVLGINKYTITTPSELVDSNLVLNGEGFNASNIVVTQATDQDFGYFEGMKSVEECEDLEVVSRNKNLWNVTQDTPFYSAYRFGEKLTISSNTITADGNFKIVEHNDSSYGRGAILKLEIGKIYTLSATLKSLGGANSIYFQIANPTNHFWHRPLCSEEGKRYSVTFTTDINTNYVMFNPVVAFGTPTSDVLLSDIQLEEGETATDYIPHASNTQTLTHEPLRSVGDIKDKYVLIDGKWYIERNCGEVVLDGSNTDIDMSTDLAEDRVTSMFNILIPNVSSITLNSVGSINDTFTTITNYNNRLDDIESVSVWSWNATSKDVIRCCINKSRLSSPSIEGFNTWLRNNPITVVYQLSTPTYEPIDYSPFTVYSDITHISNNSTIPCNMTIKNTGYNCLLKPSTTYTVSSNLGLNTVTTPSVLSEDCLRFYDTDTSTVTTMNNVTVLEGDYTTGKSIPSHFSGIESAFEQEYDEAVDKYKVKAKVVGKNLFNGEWHNGWLFNGDIVLSNNYKYCDYIRVPSNTKITAKTSFDIAEYDYNKNFIKNNGGERTTITTSSNCCYIRIGVRSSQDISNYQVEEGTEATPYEPYKENYIEFYINEPLRGIRDVKDRVYVKDDKVVVERNCGQREYQDGDFGTYLTDKVNTVYPLAEPTYEEVEYNDVKLFIESFKNSTLFYNSNIPVTSKVHYSYSVPIVDTVAKTANVTDQQDSMIIDLATQCAVMEMYLM